MNTKKHSDTGRYRSPVSVSGKDLLAHYGLWICSCSVMGKTGYRWNPGRTFDFYVISHMTGGSGEYIAGDSEVPVKLEPGDAVCVTPGFRQDIHGLSNAVPYFEDAVSFTGTIADAFCRAGIFRNGIFHLGKSRRLLPIIEKALDAAPAAQFEANIALQRLILDIYHENILPRPSRHAEYPRIEQFLKVLKSDCRRWWTLAEMAEFCNLSANQFRTVFKRFTGCPPKLYLDRLKMRQAGNLLSDRNMNLEQIADLLGYSCSFHFSRRFKEITGYSPFAYRKKFTG